MGVRAAASVFWTSFLVLFPVAVQQSSIRCVTYNRTMCALKGSSVEFPCSYPNNVEMIWMSRWSRQSTELHSVSKTNPLKQMPVYSFQNKHGNNNCTLKLEDLKESDTSVYFFKYSFRDVAGVNMTCEGTPGVRLHVFASPVRILLDKIFRGQKVPVANWTVMEGQKIMLTCVPTCTTNLNSNPDYIWYKNRLQLNGSRVNLTFLSLDPIRNEDKGSYVCAMIGYENFSSSSVDLRVERSPRNTVVSADVGSKKDSEENLTHSSDVHNSTAQKPKNCQTPKDKSMFTFSIMLVVSICVGLVIAIMVAILVLTIKRKKKRRTCVGSVPEPPDLCSDSYMALDITSMSAEYDALDTVNSCLVSDKDSAIYENLPNTNLETIEMRERKMF
ncbi:uncharacterized protein [Thunnus thynnus]|uniref:uncharacterized protein n=1 Tax=Thunnus thynnus TaxID=8237 RepID=UPI0035299195